MSWRFDVVVGCGVGGNWGGWEQRHLRVEAVVGKKRGKGGGGVLGVVVSELRQRQKLGPIGLLVICVDSQILLENRIQALRLPVRLRVKSRGAVGPYTEQLQQPAPKVAGEEGIAVADEAAGQPMQAHDLLHEQRCDLRSRHGLGGRNEVGLLRQPVDDH